MSGRIPDSIRLGIAGGIATFLGVGMARFAYTPLIPALAEAQWFSIIQANYLGAINLIGYLVGAAIAHSAAVRFGQKRTLAVCLVITLASLYGEALNWGFAWYALWRFACGVSGAVLVVIGVPASLSQVAPKDRPLTGALVFTGIGSGIAASGTIVPWLIHVGVAVTWLAMAGFSSVLAFWGWRQVWRFIVEPAKTSGSSKQSAGKRWPTIAVFLVIAAYGLDAFGIVPHSLFWVDYITHELGRGIATGAGYWTAFGLGAMAGPFIAGGLAARLGFRPSLALGLGIKAIAVILPVLTQAPAALLVSSVLVGMWIPGTVSLTSGSLIELTPIARQQQVWGWATVSFALLQAGAGYGMSWGYDILHTYQPLFILSAVALCAGVACTWAAFSQPVWEEK